MKKTLLKAAALAMLIFSSQEVISQVGIGTTLPHSSSILEIQSANSGLLIPRVSLASTTDNFTIPSPATSLLVYNISTVSDVTPGYYYWDGFWKQLMVAGSAGADDWKLLGNTLLTGNEYLGTNNYYPFVLKTNSNEIARFHPNGGINMGIGSMTNPNQSVAIGDFSDASGQVKAFAIGVNSYSAGTSAYAIGEGSNSTNTHSIAFGNSTVSSGTSSTALGYSSEATATYATAVVYDNTASGVYSTAIGSRSNASGLRSTAIGYNATTSQQDAIVLGNHTNSSLRVGIGTNTPDEKLHVVGSFKLVDGTQGFNKFLVSDANGKARWADPNSYKIYGEIYKTIPSVLDQYSNINFDVLGISQNATLSSTAIQNQTTVGIFKITYSITIQKNSGSTIVPYFYLTRNGAEIPGSRAYITIGNNETKTVSITKYSTIGSWQQISVRSSISDTDTNIIGGNLIVEFIN